jgi:hypothetical protein
MKFAKVQLINKYNLKLEYENKTKELVYKKWNCT